VDREPAPERITMNGGRVFELCKIGSPHYVPPEEMSAHFAMWHDDERRDEESDFFYDPHRNRDQPTFPRRRDQPKKGVHRR